MAGFFDGHAAYMHVSGYLLGSFTKNYNNDVLDEHTILEYISTYSLYLCPIFSYVDAWMRGATEELKLFTKTSMGYIGNWRSAESLERFEEMMKWSLHLYHISNEMAYSEHFSWLVMAFAQVIETFQSEFEIYRTCEFVYRYILPPHATAYAAQRYVIPVPAILQLRDLLNIKDAQVSFDFHLYGEFIQTVQQYSNTIVINFGDDMSLMKERVHHIFLQLPGKKIVIKFNSPRKWYTTRIFDFLYKFGTEQRPLYSPNFYYEVVFDDSITNFIDTVPDKELRLRSISFATSIFSSLVFVSGKSEKIVQFNRYLEFAYDMEKTIKNGALEQYSQFQTLVKSGKTIFQGTEEINPVCDKSRDLWGKAFIAEYVGNGNVKLERAITLFQIINFECDSQYGILPSGYLQEEAVDMFKISTSAGLYIATSHRDFSLRAKEKKIPYGLGFGLFNNSDDDDTSALFAKLYLEKSREAKYFRLLIELFSAGDILGHLKKKANMTEETISTILMVRDRVQKISEKFQKNAKEISDNSSIESREKQFKIVRIRWSAITDCLDVYNEFLPYKMIIISLGQ